MASFTKSSCLSVLVFSYLVPTVSAAYTHYVDDTCQIVGDTDVYGIGVRIGYYLTFFAGVISIIFKDFKSISSLLPTVIIIYLAIFIIMLRNTFIADSFTILDWYITTNLGIIMIPALMGSIVADQEGKISQLGSWGAALLLSSVVGGLQPWIIWVRINQGRDTECPSPKISLFGAKWDLYNPHYIQFMRVMSIASCITAPVVLCAGLYLLYSSARGVGTLKETTVAKGIHKWIRKDDGDSNPKTGSSMEDMAGFLTVLGYSAACA